MNTKNVLIVAAIVGITLILVMCGTGELLDPLYTGESDAS